MSATVPDGKGDATVVADPSDGCGAETDVEAIGEDRPGAVERPKG